MLFIFSDIQESVRISEPKDYPQNTSSDTFLKYKPI